MTEERCSYKRYSGETLPVNSFAVVVSHFVLQPIFFQWKVGCCRSSFFGQGCQSIRVTSFHQGYRLVGLVERKIRGSNPACDGIFPDRIIPVTSKLALQWLPCQAPGIIGSALGLVGPVSVYCGCVSCICNFCLSVAACKIV